MTLKTLTKETFSLGEGLFINQDLDLCSWVDIDKKKVHIIDIIKNSMISFEHKKIPSNIFSLSSDNLIILDDFGISSYDFYGNLQKKIFYFSNKIINNKYRANDGVLKNHNSFFFGTMQKSTTISKKGKIYKLIDNIITKIDDCYIPNSFIFLEDDLLVSDSFTGQMFIYTGKKYEKKIFFKQIDVNEGRPDGGCLGPDGLIYVCLWGGSCILRLNLNGKILDKITLPIKYPTNCKVYHKSLIITSASMEDDDGANGKTFIKMNIF